MGYVKNFKFADGDHVWVHSLGPSHGDKTYRGIIKGVAADAGPHATIYIVSMVDVVDPDYQFSCATFPEACIRHDEGWRYYKEK